MEQQVTQGLVFWFGTNIKQEFGQSNSNAEYIIQGRRPHIVISDNLVNNRGKICTLVPCTTNIGIENPYHIKIQVFPDKISMALCDQMLSVNQRDLLKNEMICELDRNSVAKVLCGCSKVLGLESDAFNSDTVKDSLSELENRIYGITDTIIKQQTSNFTESFISNITQNIANQISSKFTGVSDVHPVEKSNDDKDISHDTSSYVVTMNENGVYEIPRHHTTGNIRWSDELYNKFLSDYRNLDLEEVMHRWGFNRQKVHETKYRAVHRYDKYSNKK